MSVQPASIEFRVLGPLEVLVDGCAVAIGGPKSRTLLAMLLVRAGQPVPVERIVDELWTVAPAAAAQSVQMHVSRLRRALPVAGLLVTRPAGYAFELGQAQLDLHAFEALAEEGHAALREGDVSRARDALEQALARWRGEPFDGVEPGPELRAEAARLSEVHLTAQLARIECDLALGRQAEVMGELEALARREPFKERIRALQMLALYRDGRHADALDVYRDTHAVLAEQLGLEPSPELQELQQRILRHDRSLTAARRPAPAAADLREGSPTRVLAAAGVVVALVAAAGLLLLGPPGDADRLPRVEPQAVGVLDPASGRMVAQLQTGGRPVGMAASRGAVWIADGAAGALLRIDVRDLRPVDRVPIGPGTSAVAAGGGAVWALSSDTRTLLRIDPVTSTVAQRIGVGNGARALTVAVGAVWVLNAFDGTVSVVDVATGRARPRVPVGAGPRAVAAGRGAIWVANELAGTVTRIDARLRVPVATVRVGGGPSGLAVADDGVWVANALDATVSRIDPARNVVTATVPVPSGADALAVSGGELWVAGPRSLVALAPRTRAVTRRVAVAAGPVSLLSAGNRLWAATQAPATSHRGGTLVMEAGERSNSIDPAIAYSDRTWPMLAVVADGLVGHRRVGGAAGADIVADLARAVPAPTDGGLTYRFQLRPGLRYSTGQPVRARDVRASIERLHRMRTFALGSFALALRGERSCGPRRCDLSRGIEADDASGTVTFHLRRANPDFLINLAAATYAVLPSGTPDRDVSGPELVGTGPYRVAGFTPGREVVLARNPRFVPWSSAAQPPGFPDRIVWRLDEAPDGARADVALEPGVDVVARLRRTAPQRLHTTPIPYTEYVWLNTRVAPFDRADARRALAYAIDRAALARGLPARGRASLHATCQILTPGFPGYEPFCPFTDHPSAGDVPDAPDLARARRLVRRSGTAGTAVTFFAPADNPAAQTIGRAIVRTLRRIGYRPRLNTRIPNRAGDYYRHTLDPSTRAQAGWALWFGEIPAASNVIPPLLSCRAREPRPDILGANQAQYCDRALEPAMRRAHALQANDPAAANIIWAGLDRTLTSRAPLIPLFSKIDVHVISARVGNYQSHIRLGPLLGQAWVR